MHYNVHIKYNFKLKGEIEMKKTNNTSNGTLNFCDINKKINLHLDDSSIKIIENSEIYKLLMIHGPEEIKKFNNIKALISLGIIKSTI